MNDDEMSKLIHIASLFREGWVNKGIALFENFIKQNNDEKTNLLIKLESLSNSSLYGYEETFRDALIYLLKKKE
jgi:hypothetical protein